MAYLKARWLISLSEMILINPLSAQEYVNKVKFKKLIAQRQALIYVVEKNFAF